jgi:hypothetical protein
MGWQSRLGPADCEVLVLLPWAPFRSLLEVLMLCAPSSTATCSDTRPRRRRRCPHRPRPKGVTSALDRTVGIDDWCVDVCQRLWYYSIERLIRLHSKLHRASSRMLLLFNEELTYSAGST